MQIKWLLIPLSLIFSSALKSQKVVNSSPLRIAVFTQLYLDSSFTQEGNYRYDMQMPKYILPGLDFTEGLLTGTDSLQETNNVEIRIYDIKSADHYVSSLKKNHLFDSVQLIIGSVSGNEYRQLADIALEYQIPFLSATFPNDGGITKNPFTILLNPTIGVHINALIQFLQQSFSSSNIIVIQKKSSQDDRIRQLFENSNIVRGSKKPLKWSHHIASDSFSMEGIIPLLDSSRTNLIVCASFDERLAIQCLQYTSIPKSYNIQLVGLPNWETLKEINLPKHKDKTIYYPTAFFNDGTEPFTSFQKKFLEKTQGKASDIAFKGYDAAINFIQLLVKYQDNFINQINNTEFQKLINYNIQPVKLKGNLQPDYFENKRVYLIKKAGGQNSKTGKF